MALYDKNDYGKMASAIRFLAADMIEKANSGHPGMPLGMADVATVLFSEFLKFNPKDGAWFNRDRFILSAGHGSALLYSLFYLCGYEGVEIEDLKHFRQLGSKTAGHPEVEKICGIDMTTGPLGQGISSAVGMAIAERKLNAKFGDKLCNHYTYVMAGDGCLMEGISEETAALAGHLKLNKLVLFWDNNNITIDGHVSDVSSFSQVERFKVLGWNAIEINGHDCEQIKNAIIFAHKSDKPTLIACKTTIGFGAPTKCGTPKCHGSPLGADELAAMRQNLHWNYAPFEIPADILGKWRSAAARNQKDYDEWKAAEKAAGKTFADYISNKLPKDWNKGLNELKKQAIDENMKIATRKASNLCIEKIVPAVPQIVGGSADLAPSNLTFVKTMSTISAQNYDGDNIMYGIREHAMGAIMNGMALHGGIIPFGGTFFVFSDYLRPSIRLAALMKLGTIYVFTHDSIGVGEDGPTHQPIEHLASHRAMPDVRVFRPCDVVETAETWELALENRHCPSLLVLSRQGLPTLRRSISENLCARGGYVISPEQRTRQATIIATGSEVSLAVEAQKELLGEGIDVAVVSMPCTELFDAQPIEYQEKVLGRGPKVAVEAASKFGWEKYVGLDGDIIGMDGFGASGKAEELYDYFGINLKEVTDSVKNLLKR